MLVVMHYPEPLAIIDTETTGLSPGEDRVVEVGVLRVERGAVVRRFTSLIRQERPLPAVITNITGITDAMLDGAPAFADIAPELAQMLDGALFVAHNAPFDYGFIREEFARLGTPFAAQCLCSVRLSRELFPEYRRHDLSSIVQRHGLASDERHRAADDANAVWEFLRHAAATIPRERLARAIAHNISRGA